MHMLPCLSAKPVIWPPNMLPWLCWVARLQALRLDNTCRLQAPCGHPDNQLLSLSSSYKALATHCMPATGLTEAARVAASSLQRQAARATGKVAGGWSVGKGRLQQLSQHLGLPEVQPANALPLILASGKVQHGTSSGWYMLLAWDTWDCRRLMRSFWASGDSQLGNVKSDPLRHDKCRVFEASCGVC